MLNDLGIIKNKDLKNYQKKNGFLGVHPDYGSPGIMASTGSLGHGLAMAAGMALACKNQKKYFYVLLSDGELQEGQIWEAAIYASAKKVDNIIATIDLNEKQIDGSTDDVLSLGDLNMKFKSFGWEVINSDKGNNISEIINSLKDAKSKLGKGKPVVILMKTEMGNGVDFMMNTHTWHGIAPNDEQLKNALKQNPETLGDY